MPDIRHFACFLLIIVASGCGPVTSPFADAVSGLLGLQPRVPPGPVAVPKETVNGRGILPNPGLRDTEFDAISELIRRGDLDEVVQILEDDPSLITYHHSQQGTLLFRTLGIRGNELAKYMLERGADPNAVPFWGGNPLCGCVAAAGCRELPQHGGGTGDYLGAVELLLAHGADPERARFPRGVTLGAGWSHRPTESIFEGGERLQRHKHNQTIERSVILARIREHMGLPVDAMLPQNTNSLYLGMAQLEE